MAASLRRLVVALVTTASFAFADASAHQNGDARCVDKQPPDGWKRNTCKKQFDAGRCLKLLSKTGYCEKTCGKCTEDEENNRSIIMTAAPAKAPTNANLAVVQSTNKEGPTHDAKKVQPTIDNSATSN